MPFASHDGIRIYWKLQGSDDKPALVLLNSIGTDMSVWDGCIDRLLPAFRILRLDTRGHGASDVPDGEYSLPELASDVVAAMDSAGIERAHIAGLSLGGMVAMQIALDAPERVDRLALVCTSAAMDSAAWQARIDAVRSGGTEAIADLAMERFLSGGFAAAHSQSAAELRRNLLSMDPAGYAGAVAAKRAE
ncbi:MAG: alpha/beta fold hydrolase, partial [Martelella sp.]